MNIFEELQKLEQEADDKKPQKMGFYSLDSIATKYRAYCNITGGYKGLINNIKRFETFYPRTSALINNLTVYINPDSNGKNSTLPKIIHQYLECVFQYEKKILNKRETNNTEISKGLMTKLENFTRNLVNGFKYKSNVSNENLFSEFTVKILTQSFIIEASCIKPDSESRNLSCNLSQLKEEDYANVIYLQAEDEYHVISDIIDSGIIKYTESDLGNCNLLYFLGDGYTLSNLNSFIRDNKFRHIFKNTNKALYKYLFSGELEKGIYIHDNQYNQLIKWICDLIKLYIAYRTIKIVYPSFTGLKEDNHFNSYRYKHIQLFKELYIGIIKYTSKYSYDEMIFETCKGFMEDLKSEYSMTFESVVNDIYPDVYDKYIAPLVDSLLNDEKEKSKEKSEEYGNTFISVYDILERCKSWTDKDDEITLQVISCMESITNYVYEIYPSTMKSTQTAISKYVKVIYLHEDNEPFSLSNENQCKMFCMIFYCFVAYLLDRFILFYDYDMSFSHKYIKEFENIISSFIKSISGVSDFSKRDYSIFSCAKSDHNYQLLNPNKSITNKIETDKRIQYVLNNEKIIEANIPIINDLRGILKDHLNDECCRIIDNEKTEEKSIDIIEPDSDDEDITLEEKMVKDVQKYAETVETFENVLYELGERQTLDKFATNIKTLIEQHIEVYLTEILKDAANACMNNNISFGDLIKNIMEEIDD